MLPHHVMEWDAPSVDTPRAGAEAACFHCGEPCRDGSHEAAGRAFCCAGCRTVFELLTENGLADFYEFGEVAGVKSQGAPPPGQFHFLDEPAVRRRVTQYTDDRLTRVQFRIPAIHCMACVWLLENLFRLQPGIGSSRVNFARKEVSIGFATAEVRLSEVAALLTSLGYEPDLNLADLDQAGPAPGARRLWLQMGVAGFAFGNIMLFSVSSYFGLDHFSGPHLKKLFGWISLLLSLPVIAYSAADYWRAAWVSLRQRRLTLDVPIALGMAAFLLRSAHAVIFEGADGYFDSLTGLIFFLLCGKWFQQKTFDRLVFDRDYKSFFPLSVTRRTGINEERAALSQLRIGDRIVLRHGELIPADATLADGAALIDYSFVTGESAPVEKQPGDYLYAGGRQVGGAMEILIVKQVSQSYLTSLWNQDAFRKRPRHSFATLTDRYSRRFTASILSIASGAAIYWAWRDPALAVPAFTAVLIVACPCALALAAPFGLGAAQRLLARRGVFLKDASALETLAAAGTIVFDKTGTLSAAGLGEVIFAGEPLTPDERSGLFALAGQSAHPIALAVRRFLKSSHSHGVSQFHEIPGSGIEGRVAGHWLRLGSASWLNLAAPRPGNAHLMIDGHYRGAFALACGVRPEIQPLLQRLARTHELALLSGDNENERERFAQLFPRGSEMRFNQSPLDKLHFIKERQAAGRTVIMVGDGLNDAGALKQSDAGVAVMEHINGFSPASDVILAASALPRLDETLRLARAAVRIVRVSFFISAAYNVVGVAIAARGLLAPVICAILMPLSSASVVAFACAATSLAAWRIAFGRERTAP
ncbi:MAG TPA: heavy metal translocating P-type ATPase metal-binding domain-containing protein [Verrucomicrobiae bacterium]|jgi:Cu+-exporting ATPase|nr:heavy metal translocating P-type ATPase metal-binding domain-containing protein [Verrucomicrobiae bacterium]